MNGIKRIKRIKRIRIHREGTDSLVWGGICIVAVALLLWRWIPSQIPFWIFVLIAGFVYGVVVNFFRCPIRKCPLTDTEHIVVAPADGRVVVIEEIDDCPCLGDRRMMISIFMSLFNVHANWFPVDGRVVSVEHTSGNFHKAWLPKASEENEHTDVVIELDSGEKVVCRQVAGAMARRIVTYAEADEDCYIDEHMGFIKFGSRVDVFLPVGTEVCVEMGQATVGDQTVIARLR